MSLVQAMPERRPSPGPLLSSNNPFRRAVSPGPALSTTAYPDAHSNSIDNRQMSRNPFLDPTRAAQPQPSSNAAALADDIFKDLSIIDRSVSNGNVPPAYGAPPRAGTMPAHRPSRSRDEEEARRAARGAARSKPAPAELDIFATPPKAENRRPRRNSEGSTMSKEKQKEEDRKRRERRKEREARREKEGRSKDGKSSSSSKPAKKPLGLDIIDKLDVTGVYGQGLFHHDGPFDACNPHRNRKTGARAPMQAFPAGSANNTLGGSGPVNNFDHDRFHGRGTEGFADYARSGATEMNGPAARGKQQPSFNPTDRIEQVHGQETYGLGTSTFLEGAPAPKLAMQRRESETESSTMQNGGGITRKKSLAVRLKGISQPRGGREYSATREGTSPGKYTAQSPDSPPTSAQSAGGMQRTKYGIREESNPFFKDDYNDAYEKKGAQIRVAEGTNGPLRQGSYSNPRSNGLTRSITADSAASASGKDEGSSGGGFLSRMISLKGGRRARPEIRS